MGYVITNLLAESLNAYVTYDFVNTWGYGDYQKPRNLTGLTGRLVRNEIDIAGVIEMLFSMFLSETEIHLI